MKASSLIILFFVLVLPAAAQDKVPYKGFPSLVWPKLYDITYVEATDKIGTYNRPVFPEATRALNGKSVTLPGYMVPFTNGTRGAVFILTSLPLNACFFCGVGGPETVIEVHLKEPISYTDKLVEISGILRLNDRDPDQMIYRLDQAVFEGEIDF